MDIHIHKNKGSFIQHLKPANISSLLFSRERMKGITVEHGIQSLIRWLEKEMKLIRTIRKSFRVHCTHLSFGISAAEIVNILNVAHLQEYSEETEFEVNI